MIQIETGKSMTFRFDDALSIDICDILTEIALMMDGGPVENGKMPWQSGETMPFFSNVKNDYLIKSIKEYGEKIGETILSCYNEKAYIHFTDLVLWKEGRYMNRHKDDGYSDKDIMYMRHFTTVTYLNDDYIGGETVVYEKDSDMYINAPKKGSILILLSDDRCEHSVNRIIKGNRVTLPMWFTKDINHKEKVNI